MNNTIWILTACAADAKLWETDHLGGKLTLLENIPHPAGQQMNADLVSSRPGGIKVGGFKFASYETTAPKTIELENFAQMLAHKIETSRAQNAFNRLVVIAAPHFLGSFLKHCSKQLLSITTHLEKDYIELSAKELQEKLAELPK